MVFDYDYLVKSHTAVAWSLEVVVKEPLVSLNWHGLTILQNDQSDSRKINRFYFLPGFRDCGGGGGGICLLLLFGLLPNCRL